MLTTSDTYRMQGRLFLDDNDRPVWTDQESNAVYAILDAVREYASANESLREAACRLSNEMQRVVEKVDADHHVNSLGEVQGRALDVDRACALREKAAENVRRVAWSVVRMEALTEEQVASVLDGTPFAKEWK